MNKGVQSLVDNWSTWKDTLKTVDRTSEDYAKTAIEVKGALSDLLGVLDEDYIPDGFIEMPGIMELIDKAAKGDTSAINKLGMKMAEATAKSWEFIDGMEDL
jgi:hypothetical protein